MNTNFIRLFNTPPLPFLTHQKIIAITLKAGHNDTSPWEASEQAKKALGQLLGKALNLLSPKAAAEAAAEVAAKAAANAEAAVNAQAGANAVDNLAESKDASSPSTVNNAVQAYA